MFNRMRMFMFVMLITAAVAYTLPTMAQDGTADNPIDCTPAEGETITIAAAYLYAEYNYTAGDIGVHGFFDDDGWSELCVYDPNGTLVLAVKPQAHLKDQTISGIFFESREPPLDEFAYKDLTARFPEGQYTVVGTNYDGKGLAGIATFTHNVPLAPVITFPELVEDEETAENSDEAVVSIDDLVVEWEDVTETVAGDPVVITAYEVIVTLEGYEDPHGFSQPIFDVHVPPDRNSLTVSAEFLEPATVYQIEVLALEESGNQTISEGFFKTE